MMQGTFPTINLVLVGGGHTHAIALRKIGMNPLPGVQLTLITNLVDTPYSGMLPCHISGRYGFDESHIDLRPLTRFAQCRLVMDRAIGLDLEQQQVICAHHPPIAYDVLSIDTGSTPATVAVPGAAEHTIPAKPVPELLHRWQEILDEIRAQPHRPLTLGIVGGGVGGVELTLNMQERARRLLRQLGSDPDLLTLHMFHRGAALAPGRNHCTRRRLGQIFRQRQIQLHLRTEVTAVTAASDRYQVQCASGLTVDCDYVIWVTSAAAPQWPREAGLSVDEQGFIQVRDTLQTCSHDNVFAVGDVATMVNHPRPKAGVFAVRQGAPLLNNLRRLIQGRPLKPFTPQKQFLNLIDVGYGVAIASRGPLMFESSLARRWKNHIDQKFMNLFREFPEMGNGQKRGGRREEGGDKKEEVRTKREKGSSSQMVPGMRCAGCGSKVGSDALQRALRRVRSDFPVIEDWPDVVVGLEAPDDAAVMRVPVGRAIAHTVDGFRAMVDDPFIFAQIALNHCLSDLYAMGATPQSVLAWMTVPYGSSAIQGESLYQLLCGVQKVLGAIPAPLVGGHTTEGPDLALGFACNGLVDPQHLLRKSGMQAGDQLILTRPLGSGILFAADMQKQSKGRWIEAAISELLQSNQTAARCLIQHGANACTDITGFGLIGHLLEMVQASQVNVELILTHLPLFNGVRDCLTQGIYSSLYPDNLEAANAIQSIPTINPHPDFPVLFDPQTAGGLLAAIPSDQTTTCLTALHQAGYLHSLVIGQVVPLENPAQPIRIKAW